MKSIEIDGKEYRLEYHINAACEAEDKGEKPFSAIINDAFVVQDKRALRLFLWGALREHYPEYTLTDAGNLARKHGDDVELMRILYEECKQAGFFGKAEEKTPPKKRASAKSTATS